MSTRAFERSALRAIPIVPAREIVVCPRLCPEGRNRRSALFNTIFLAFRDNGAKDWRSNLAISIDHSGSHHRLHFYHIFPKAQLKKHYTSREADDIANLVFIGGKTNRAISDKPPSKYLPPLIDEHGLPTFAAQAIPTESSLLEVASYKDFLTKRRALIADQINEFLSASGSAKTR